MRRVLTWLAALALVGAIATPCRAATLVVTPAAPKGFWAGTRLKLVAERASAGRLRVHVEGTVAARRPGRAVLFVISCGAGTDPLSSYDWSPERHPSGRQAVPGWPVS